MRNVRKRVIGGLLSIVMSLVCVIGLLPSQTALAAASVSGGHTDRATAYVWGSYTDNKNISVTLPADEDDVWISFSLTAGTKIFARCSYYSSNEGMSIEMWNSSGERIDREFSPEEVHDLDTVTPFLAVNCDNDTSSTSSFYIHVNRGTAVGKLSFSITLKNRIRTGSGTFSFSGTASNPGNSSASVSGVDSSILTLNLTDNTNIPTGAIVTSVRTYGTQSPSQGNVRHMILPASQTTLWYTSTIAGATGGTYAISESDGFEARQIWQFKYNALATAKSTMKNVTISLQWTYDLADTDYKLVV